MGAAFKRIRNDVSIGMYEDICVRCAEKLHPSQRATNLGLLTGKKVYYGYSLNGSKFCLCEDCLKEIAKSL